MKKQIKLLSRIIVCGVLPLAFVASCSVDDKYDMSKDIDMTVGVGKGLALPIGSTEKIMLSEFIDPEDSDVIMLDEDSAYSVYEEGTFDETSFKIDPVSVTIDPYADPLPYDFNMSELGLDDVLNNYGDLLTDEIKALLGSFYFPYKVSYDDISNNIEFSINETVDEAIKELKSMTFDPIKMKLDLEISGNDEASGNLLNKTNELRLLSSADGDDKLNGFIVELPEYLVFSEEDNVKDGKIYLDGSVKYDKASKSMKYFDKNGNVGKELTIMGLDFSLRKEGPLKVVNKQMSVSETLKISGAVESDMVLFTASDLIVSKVGVTVKPKLNFGTMSIKDVTGKFDPKIDAIEETLDLNLGDDLDFLSDPKTLLDFEDPRIYVTINNPVNAKIHAEASFVGKDKGYNIIEGSKVDAELNISSIGENKLFINQNNTEEIGYRTVNVENLSNLIKRVPELIDVKLDVNMDSESYTTVTLNEDMKIYGAYELKVPMKFTDFELEYVEEVDDVLGDDADDITDYVTDINSVTITFDVFNTIPAEFTPMVVAYDRNGNELKNVTADVKNVIEMGHGMKEDGKTVSDPVKSSVTVNLSVKNGELDKLYKLDLKFIGRGSGTFNAKEYLQVKDIVVTIDDHISVDLN